MKRVGKLELMRLIKNKDYLAFWLSTTFSMAASNILQFALALFVLEITGSATIFATTLSIIIIPRVLLTPIAGVWADRYSRIKMMSLMSAVATLVLAVFWYVGFTSNALTLMQVYILVVCLEMVEVIYQAPASAIIPELVEQDILEEAVSVSQVDDYVVYACAPAISAVVYKAFGIVGALGAAALCFLIATALRFLIHPSYERKKEVANKNMVREFKEGICALKENDFIRSLTILAPISNFFLGSLFSVTITYFILEVVGASEAVYALYRTTIASIGIVVPLVAVPLVSRTSPAKVLTVSMGVCTAALAGITLVVSMWPDGIQDPYLVIILITLLDCIGVATIIPANMAIGICLQKDTPEKYRSRIISVFRMFALTSVPLGQLFYGYITDAWLIWQPIGFAALATAGITLGYRRIAKNRGLYQSKES